MDTISKEELVTTIERRLKNTRDYMRGARKRNPASFSRNPGYLKASGKESAYDAVLCIIQSLSADNPNDRQP